MDRPRYTIEYKFKSKHKDKYRHLLYTEREVIQFLFNHIKRRDTGKFKLLIRKVR